MTMGQVTARLAAALGDRYVIERELGTGGMATVYLARDRKHEREVAVKVLHPDLAAVLGAERFLSEIKTTANLQHPHILALHDSGEADGFLYYVMPFVQGESLRAHLTREKQLPLEEAVRIGQEVAAALSHAHSHGVVHRDIKPENILLQSGHALVADFGIALAVQQAGGHRLTHTGLSLGTPQYMAPEQAMAERTIDLRADIYALGAVVYEMLTGEPPFTGATMQTVIAKVMTERPIPPTRVRDTVPPGVEAAVLKALARLPADRFASAREFADALERPATTAGAWTTTAVAPIRTRRRAVTISVAAGLALLLLVAGWLGGQLTRSNPSTAVPSHLIVPVPDLRSSGGGAGGRKLALTPDGSTLVYMAATPSGNHPMVRRFHLLEAVPLKEVYDLSRLAPATDGAILGLIGDRLTRIPLVGGIPIAGPVIGTQFFAPHPDGSIWLTRPPYTRLERIAPQGNADSLEVRFADLPNLRLLQILDDGGTAILTQFQPGAPAGLCFVMDLRTGQRSALPETSVRDARYTSGFLVYVNRSNALFAVALDPRSRRTIGVPVRIADSVAGGDQGIAQLAVAPNGTVAYIPLDELSLVFVDRAGNERRAHADLHNYHAPRFSPDGRRVAVDFMGTDDTRDVWILDPEQNSLQRASFSKGADVGGHDPTWTPDGRYLSYLVQRDSVWQVFRTRASGGAPPESLFARRGGLAFTGLWLPDGSALIPVTGVGGEDIAIVRNGGHGAIEPLVATPDVVEYAPAPSPDGRWLAFVSDKSGPGRWEVYLRGLGNDPTEIKVSQNGGAEPVWSPVRSRDGWELFYRRGGDRDELMSARIEERPTPHVTERHTLFSISDIVTGGNHANYDVSPDARTFVMVRSNPKARIVVIQNLPALVDRLGGNTP